MTILRYRLTVVGCALASFLVGLHLPALHSMTSHGAPADPVVLGIVALLAALALGGVWALLRGPVR